MILFIHLLLKYLLYYNQKLIFFFFIYKLLNLLKYEK